MRSIGALALAAPAILASVVGCSSQPAAEPAEPLEPFDVVAASQPVITSVTTDDGFTQVRQNATVTLVIKGKKLQHTTGVTIGAFLIFSLDSVAAHEVRVTAFGSTATPLGPVDVTVTSADTTTTAPGAIRLTPFVVSPTAVTGHGTFQSPMSLCDPDLELSVGSGSVVRLLPGTHRCGRQLFLNGGTFVGDPDEPTIITGTAAGGFGMFANAFGTPMTFRNLTFAPPLAGWTISFGGDELDLQRVVDAGGILADDNTLVKLDHYTYEGEGTGLDLHGADIQHSTIRHCGSGDGIVARHNSNGPGVTISHTRVEDCDLGLVLVPPDQRGLRIVADISNSRFIDNRIGISAAGANTTIHDTVVRGHSAGPRVSSVGVAVSSGNTTLSNVEITGQQDTGLGVFHILSDDEDALVFVSSVTIVGGHFGIDLSGIDNQLTVRGSTVRGQTVASLAISNVDGRADLGTPSSPGNNQLSVISGFVIDDTRSTESFFSRYTFATGTTLNGVSFDGQTIDGPAELAPFYRIANFDAGIQF